jgi:hypothetical protein
MAEHQPETVEKNLELDDDGKPRRTGTYFLSKFSFHFSIRFFNFTISLILEAYDVSSYVPDIWNLVINVFFGFL